MATPTLDRFRDEVRSFFDGVLPGVLDGVDGQLARARAWRAALYDAVRTVATTVLSAVASTVIIALPA